MKILGLLSLLTLTFFSNANASTVKVGARILEKGCFNQDKTAELGFVIIDKKFQNLYAPSVSLIYQLLDKNGRKLSDGTLDLSGQKNAVVYTQILRLRNLTSEASEMNFYFKINPNDGRQFFVDRGINIDFADRNIHEGTNGEALPHGVNLMKRVSPSYEELDHQQDEGFLHAPFYKIKLPEASCETRLKELKIRHHLLD